MMVVAEAYFKLRYQHCPEGTE